jgi:hypothetical protein
MAGIANAVEAKAAATNLLIWIPFSIVRTDPTRTTPAERSWELKLRNIRSCGARGRGKDLCNLHYLEDCGGKATIGARLETHLNRRREMGRFRSRQKLPMRLAGSRQVCQGWPIGPQNRPLGADAHFLICLKWWGGPTC